jgi:hypothetical protein
VFPLRPLNWHPVDTRPLSSDLRAAYFRYTIVATSRYAGFAPVATLSAGRFANPNVLDQNKVDVWRRILVPCRMTSTPPPKPILKLVLPLTQASTAADARSQCPGLLAIFSDTWFQKAGLAETIRAEIELRRYTPLTPPGGAPCDFAEFGAEPILDGTTIATQTPISQYCPALVTSGPSGTTFDGEAQEALYTRSWFIVEALPIVDKPDFFEWKFAKLRFRRGLAVESLEPKPARVADFSKTTAFDLTSEFDRGGNIGSRNIRVTLSNSGNVIARIDLSYPSDPFVNATTAIPAGSATASFIAYSRIVVKFEFRSFGTTKKDQPASTWLVTPYVAAKHQVSTTRGEQTRWHALDPFVWSDSLPTPPLSPTLTVLNQQNTTTSPPLEATPVPESDPTDSVWVQILPDSNITKVQPADGTDTTERIPVDQLRIVRSPGGVSRAISLCRIDTGATDIALGRDQPVKGGHNCFVRAIALTAKITDFRGQPSERFIGIYGGDYSTPTNPGALLQFVPLDSSQTEAPDLSATTTPSAPPSEVPPPNALLARVVTLQRRTDNGKAPDQIQKVWSDLFAAPADFAFGVDEIGRIVSVSLPFGES